MSDRDTVILVVEPDESARETLERRLTDRGFRVVGAESVDRAGEVLQSLPPDLVIAAADDDGEGSPWTELRRELPIDDVFFLFVGTNDSVKARRRAFDQGADDYLAKPFHVDALIAHAEALIKHGISSAGSGSGEGWLVEDGAIKPTSLAGLLRQVEAEGYTGTVSLVANRGNGSLVLDRGKVTDASIEQLRGLSALLVMDGWRAGSWIGRFATVTGAKSDDEIEGLCTPDELEAWHEQIEGLPALDAAYEHTGEPPPEVEEVGAEQVVEVYGLFDGRRRLGEVISASPLGPLQTVRILDELLDSGCIEQVEGSESDSPADRRLIDWLIEAEVEEEEADWIIRVPAAGEKASEESGESGESRESGESGEFEESGESEEFEESGESEEFEAADEADEEGAESEAASSDGSEADEEATDEETEQEGELPEFERHEPGVMEIVEVTIDSEKGARVTSFETQDVEIEHHPAAAADGVEEAVVGADGEGEPEDLDADDLSALEEEPVEVDADDEVPASERVTDPEGHRAVGAEEPTTDEAAGTDDESTARGDEEESETPVGMVAVVALLVVAGIAFFAVGDGGDEGGEGSEEPVAESEPADQQEPAAPEESASRDESVDEPPADEQQPPESGETAGEVAQKAQTGVESAADAAKSRVVARYEEAAGQRAAAIGAGIAERAGAMPEAIAEAERRRKAEQQAAAKNEESKPEPEPAADSKSEQAESGSEESSGAGQSAVFGRLDRMLDQGKFDAVESELKRLEKEGANRAKIGDVYLDLATGYRFEANNEEAAIRVYETYLKLNPDGKYAGEVESILGRLR